MFWIRIYILYDTQQRWLVECNECVPAIKRVALLQLISEIFSCRFYKARKNIENKQTIIRNLSSLRGHVIKRLYEYNSSVRKLLTAWINDQTRLLNIFLAYRTISTKALDILKILKDRKGIAAKKRLLK